MKHISPILLIISSLCVTSLAWSIPAFPGAEGFGASASGGRGGAVYTVTTLASSGEGSLQWAVDQPGARIIVFGISGVITGDVRIPHGDLTIAGQTAPGAGITINGHLSTPYRSTFGNMIIRHIRIRPPGPDQNWPPAQHDAIQFSGNTNIILDHIDVSHGVDETIDLFAGAQYITVQWSTIALPVKGGGHPDGPNHNYGLINGPDGGFISIHHNLFAHNRTRTPALASGPAEVINNVVYNGREGFVHHNPAKGDFQIIGNTYRRGPSTAMTPFWFDPENGPMVPSRYHVHANQVDDPGVFEGMVNSPFSAPQTFQDAYTYACCGTTAAQFVDMPFNFSSDPSYITTSIQTAPEAYADILDKVGAFPRDLVSQWAIDETTQRTGEHGNRRPTDWLEGLTPTTAPTDTDMDGMPDQWEMANKLDPQTQDHNTMMPGGYSAIETYINARAAQLIGELPVMPMTDMGGTRDMSMDMVGADMTTVDMTKTDMSQSGDMPGTAPTPNTSTTDDGGCASTPAQPPLLPVIGVVFGLVFGALRRLRAV